MTLVASRVAVPPLLNSCPRTETRSLTAIWVLLLALPANWVAPEVSTLICETPPTGRNGGRLLTEKLGAAAACTVAEIRDERRRTLPPSMLDAVDVVRRCTCTC